jgi:hypothetical protein
LEVAIERNLTKTKGIVIAPHYGILSSDCRKMGRIKIYNGRHSGGAKPGVEEKPSFSQFMYEY